MGKKISPPGNHRVDEGDWLSKIAKWYGLPNWKVLWDHPNNAALRQKRKNPDTLHPGDEVFIPAVESKTIAREAEQRHRFKLKQSNLKFRITLLDSAKEPRQHVPYRLVVGAFEHEGQTSSEGLISVDMPDDSEERGELHIDGQCIEIQLGALDPIEAVSGVQARLINLGYDPGPIDGIYGNRTKGSVQWFQQEHDLEDNGIMRPQTCSKLAEIYGC